MADEMAALRAELETALHEVRRLAQRARVDLMAGYCDDALREIASSAPRLGEAERERLGPSASLAARQLAAAATAIPPPGGMASFRDEIDGEDFAYETAVDRMYDLQGDAMSLLSLEVEDANDQP